MPCVHMGVATIDSLMFRAQWRRVYNKNGYIVNFDENLRQEREDYFWRLLFDTAMFSEILIHAVNCQPLGFNGAFTFTNADWFIGLIQAIIGGTPWNTPLLAEPIRIYYFLKAIIVTFMTVMFARVQLDTLAYNFPRALDHLWQAFGWIWLL